MAVRVPAFLVPPSGLQHGQSAELPGVGDSVISAACRSIDTVSLRAVRTLDCRASSRRFLVSLSICKQVEELKIVQGVRAFRKDAHRRTEVFSRLISGEAHMELAAIERFGGIAPVQHAPHVCRSR